MTWFARGLGAAHGGELAEAHRACDRLEQLKDAAAKTGDELFARNITVLRLEVRAWLAQAEKDEKASIDLMQEAVELEGSTPKHPVTPAPTLPAYELLGDLLLAQKRPAEAFAAYQRSLELYPRRFNSLLGAGRAARAAGNDTEARTFFKELLQVAQGSSRQLVLGEAKAFLAREK